MKRTEDRGRAVTARGGKSYDKLIRAFEKE